MGGSGTDSLTGECSACGSRDIETLEREYATGVTSPDGGREWWRVVVVRCRECGAMEEV